MIRFDGEDLFGRGVHEMTFGSWERERLVRRFAGLDGEVRIDLGRKGRRIGQKGSLAADNLRALQKKIDVVEDYLDGKDHTLIDENGQSHEHVEMVSFEWNIPLNRSDHFSADYEIEYKQWD